MAHFGEVYHRPRALSKVPKNGWCRYTGAMPASTPLFDRLPEPKRRLVLDTAAAEFARQGFAAAKVDLIAAGAGISVGSLYQYFGTKENCFLAVLEDGLAELQGRLDEVLVRHADPWDRIEALVRLIPGHSREHAAVLRLYHEVAGEAMAGLDRDFCDRFEGLSARIYAGVLAEARAAGAVRADLEEHFAAFCLDNLFMALQASFSGGYHRRRKAVYLGDWDGDDEALVTQTLAFLRFGLAGKP